jgi:hypothetical protein
LSPLWITSARSSGDSGSRAKILKSRREDSWLFRSVSLSAVSPARPMQTRSQPRTLSLSVSSFTSDPRLAETGGLSASSIRIRTPSTSSPRFFRDSARAKVSSSISSVSLTSFFSARYLTPATSQFFRKSHAFRASSFSCSRPEICLRSSVPMQPTMSEYVWVASTEMLTVMNLNDCESSSV